MGGGYLYVEAAQTRIHLNRSSERSHLWGIEMPDAEHCYRLLAS